MSLPIFKLLISTWGKVISWSSQEGTRYLWLDSRVIIPQQEDLQSTQYLATIPARLSWFYKIHACPRAHPQMRKSPRWSSRKTCLCTNQIDLMSRKLNCTKCGQIFCERCVEDGEYLPSNSSGKLMFICKKCLGISWKLKAWLFFNLVYFCFIRYWQI